MLRYNHITILEAGKLNLLQEAWQSIMPGIGGSSMHIERSEDCFNGIGKYNIHKRPEYNLILC